MKLRFSPDVWVAPIADGVAVGSGDQIRHRLQLHPKLAASIEGLLETYGAADFDSDAAQGELDQAIPAFSRKNLFKSLLQIGVLESVDDGGVIVKGDEREAREKLAPALKDLCKVEGIDFESSIARLSERTVTGFVDERLSIRLRPLAKSFGLNLSSVRSITQEESAEIATGQVPEVPEGDLILGACTTSIGRYQLFPTLNALAISQKTPVLFGYIDGGVATAGPLVIPGETACMRCVEIRENAHLPKLDDRSLFKRIVADIPVSAGPTAHPLGAEWLANELVHSMLLALLRTKLPPTYDFIIRRDIQNNQTDTHYVLKVPLCDACGRMTERPFLNPWVY